MNAFKVLSILLVLHRACTAHAGVENPFSIQDLERMLNNRNYTKIEDLIQAMPIEQRSSYTLVYDTHSLQGADPQNPRAIMYGRDASFMIAFNSGNPSFSGHDKLEMIQFDKNEAKFHFFETYRAPNNTIKVKEQTTNCTSCHETDLRPNWQPYSDWPGVYGSVDDMLRSRESPANEYSNLKTFLSTAEKHPRYSALVNLVSGYKFPRGSSRTNQLHNTNFTFRLSLHNLQRVARLMKNTPGYDKYKYAIFGSTQCKYNFSQFFPEGTAPKVNQWNQLTSQQPPTGTPAFNTVMSLWGVDWSSYTTMFHLVNSSPFRGELFNTSSSPENEFAGAMTVIDPNLQYYALRSTYSNSVNAGSIAVWGLINNCDGLAKKSREALSQ